MVEHYIMFLSDTDELQADVLKANNRNDFIYKKDASSKSHKGDEKWAEEKVSADLKRDYH